MINKFKGCLIGLALGDVLGAPFEFWEKEEVAHFFEKKDLAVIPFERANRIWPAGYYTDDTSMMICLAESLISKGFDLTDQFNRYKKWLLEGYGTPDGKECFGIGQQTLRALSLDSYIQPKDDLNKKAGGNGSLMRSAPIGLYYFKNYQDIKEKSLASSSVTHNYFISGWTCVVLNAIISLILEGVAKSELRSKVLEIYPDRPTEIAEVLKSDFSNLKNSGYSLDSLEIALWGFLTGQSFKDSLKKVISLGGDTDTYGAICGAMVGCYEGLDNIPKSWLEKLMRGEYLSWLGEKIYEVNSAK